MIDSADEAMRVLEATRLHFLTQARAVAVKYAIDHHGSACADDIHELCPVPDTIDGRVMGAVFSDRARWQPAGYIKSRRKICHGRPIQVFHLIGYDSVNA